MNLTITPAQLAEVEPLLLKVLRFDTTDGAQGVPDLAADAYLFKVIDQAGQIKAAYSLRVNTHEKKTVAWVVAAAGRLPGFDLISSIMPAIKDQARAAGATQVAIITKRPGMIKKMKSQGLQVTGVVMRGAI